MPTPGGLLKAGDRIVHRDMPNIVFVVQTRTSSSNDYAVYVAREDGEDMPIKLGGRPQYLLLEAGWKIAHSKTSGWSLLPPKGEPRIWVRLTKPTQFYTGWEHEDIDITDLAFWERPGGWQVACISIGDKGLPPWDDIPPPDAQAVRT